MRKIRFSEVSWSLLTNWVGKEDLRGRIDPALWGEELGPVGGDVEQETLTRPLQGHRPHQQGEHHEVRKQRREPDDLNREKKGIFLKWVQFNIVVCFDNYDRE